MYVCVVCMLARSPHGVEEGVISPRTGVTYGCDLSARN